MEYLTEEVLHSQTPEVQSFLLRTSILERYFRFYNQERPHQSPNYATPVKVHYGAKERDDSVPVLTYSNPFVV
ncbi:MAG: transposase [Anaerolineae bacterium]|nr:transposase [Anaerolineae bacterium]